MDKKMEQVFFAMLGGALAVKEKLEASQEELKAWQEKSEANARSFFDDMAARGEQEKDQLKEMLRELLREAINDLGLATREDLQQLKKDLDK